MCVFVLRLLKTHSASKFQLYNALYVYQIITLHILIFKCNFISYFYLNKAGGKEFPGVSQIAKIIFSENRNSSTLGIYHSHLNFQVL